ncbi:hypothetical protein [Actinoplanes sp. G11-F43]|uniref:hypothetical protein n=1 Tax=Actinoplanes sp. G11-F43 TaxID=3424130 RepID=UPI003D3432E7
MRAAAVDRPREADDVFSSNLHRMMVWMGLMFGFLFLFVPTSFLPTPDVLIQALAVLFTFACGLVLLSACRLFLSKILEGPLRARLDDRPIPRPGFVGWLTYPNDLDVLTGLLFAACMAPPLF